MKDIWHYLLSKSLFVATAIIWGVSAIVYMIAMGVLYWWLKKH